MATINDLIRKTKLIGGVFARAAPKAADAVDRVVRAQLSSGVAPSTGAAWVPTVAGRRALPNAGARLTSALIGHTIVMTMPFPYGIHNKGAGKTLPARPTLPTTITDPIAAAITRAFEAEFKAAERG